MADYQIFVDTTADICSEMLEGLPPARFIPMDVEIAGQQFQYGPGGNLTVEQFYALQREGNFARTTQISPGMFLSWFEPVLQAGQDLIYFPLTSGLSGTCQSAEMCMEDLRKQYPERTIVCVDTFCVSAGQGFLLQEILRKKAAGLSLEELADWVRQNRLHVCHWFNVDVFEHLKQGGRVSAATAALGTALQIKPMLRVNDEGKLEIVDKPRGRKRAIAAQVARLNAGWMPEAVNTVIVAHGDDLEGARMLREEILASQPDAHIYTVPIGPIIGAHTGPGMLATVYWGNNR